MYDKRCSYLSEEEINKNLICNPNPIIRFKHIRIPNLNFKDGLYGFINVESFNRGLLDDFVILKSDGFPTYHFANVIDDYLMKITHVLRGEVTQSIIILHKYVWILIRNG